MNTNCAGECFYNDIKLEYHIQALDYVVGKQLIIECVCLNPYNHLDNEMVFKFATTNSKSLDEKGNVAMSIIHSLIKSLGLDSDKLRKLSVRERQVFFVCLP
jgi:hypothetical protein